MKYQTDMIFSFIPKLSLKRIDLRVVLKLRAQISQKESLGLSNTTCAKFLFL